MQYIVLQWTLREYTELLKLHPGNSREAAFPLHRHSLRELLSKEMMSQVGKVHPLSNNTNQLLRIIQQGCHRRLPVVTGC